MSESDEVAMFVALDGESTEGKITEARFSIKLESLKRTVKEELEKLGLSYIWDKYS